jgi:O-acetyl-ADP-ribose deacetylase (regulator of RNase III)
MITDRTGSIFDSHADALVVPVNCVGVAGKGLALEFKRRWPEWFRAYRAACETRDPGRLIAGRVFAYFVPSGGPWIIALPTKDHWRRPPDLGLINLGLNSLRRWLIANPQVETIAVPALGCGLGGLEWTRVKPLIENWLDLGSPGSGVRVLLYEPQESPQDNPQVPAP